MGAGNDQHGGAGAGAAHGGRRGERRHHRHRGQGPSPVRVRDPGDRHGLGCGRGVLADGSTRPSRSPGRGLAGVLASDGRCTVRSGPASGTPRRSTRDHPRDRRHPLREVPRWPSSWRHSRRARSPTSPPPRSTRRTPTTPPGSSAIERDARRHGPPSNAPSPTVCPTCCGNSRAPCCSTRSGRGSAAIRRSMPIPPTWWRPSPDATATAWWWPRRSDRPRMPPPTSAVVSSTPLGEVNHAVSAVADRAVLVVAGRALELPPPC